MAVGAALEAQAQVVTGVAQRRQGRGVHQVQAQPAVHLTKADRQARAAVVARAHQVLEARDLGRRCRGAQLIGQQQVDDLRCQVAHGHGQAVGHQRDVQLVRRHGEHVAVAASHAAGVVDHLHPAVVVPHQAQRVRRAQAIGQHAGGQHLSPSGLTAHALGASQVGQPAKHVVHGGDEIALAADLLGDHQRMPPAAARPGVVVGHHVGRHCGVAGHAFGVVHAQGLEHAFVQEGLQGHAGRAVDRHRQQVVADVVVDLPHARGEVDALLARSGGGHPARGHQGHAVADHAEIKPAAPATGVVHELPQRGHALQAGQRQLGQHPADRGVDVELAFLGEQQRRQAGEVLAGGADAHARARRVGHAVAHAGQPEGLAVDDPARQGHAHDAAGRIVAVVGREERIQLGQACVQALGLWGGGGAIGHRGGAVQVGFSSRP